MVICDSSNRKLTHQMNYLVETNSPELGILSLVSNLYLMVRQPGYIIGSPKNFYSILAPRYHRRLSEFLVVESDSIFGKLLH